MKRFYIAGLVLSAVALLGLLTPASAAVRTVKLTGSGDGLEDRTDPDHPAFAFSADVQGAPLGNNAVMTGTSMVVGPDPYILGNELFVGEMTFRTSKGELLYATVAGSVEGGTGVFVGTLTWQGGTGKFANASGTAKLTGDGSDTNANSMFTFTFSVDGTIK